MVHCIHKAIVSEDIGFEALYWASRAILRIRTYDNFDVAIIISLPSLYPFPPPGMYSSDCSTVASSTISTTLNTKSGSP
jgi:hypothetical protein